jgi:hypothetical protein
MMFMHAAISERVDSATPNFPGWGLAARSRQHGTPLSAILDRCDLNLQPTE